jgi:tetratricopeptide (TPR) repeat protein
MTLLGTFLRVAGLGAGLALPCAGWGAADTVVFRDSKQQGKEVTKSGTITREAPEGVEIGSQLIQAKDIVSVTHGDAPVEYQQAEEAQQSLDFSAAAEGYRRALEAKGVRPWIQHDARFHRADCLYRMGDLAGAAAAFKEMADKAPEGRYRDRAKLRLGQCQLFQKAFVEAQASFGALKASGTEKLNAGLWAGRVEECQGNLDAARQAYEDVIIRSGRLVPEIEFAARARQGMIDVAKGEPHKALEVLLPLVEQTSAEKPGGAALCNALGQAYLAQAKAAKAKPDEAKRLAFSGLMDFCRILVSVEVHPEEHAAAYAGAEACLTLLGDVRASQFKEDRKRFYGDAFLTP